MQADQARAEIPLEHRDVVDGGSDRRNPVRRHWQAFFAAVQFLTRVPIPERFVNALPATARLELATIYFPLVGALIGLATAATIWLASHLWPTWLAVLLGLAAEALLTGALHEDALADCCDALGGGWTRADVLRILEDSRLGTYGVLGLTIAFLLRAGSITSLAAELLFPALIASAAIGRWAMVLALSWLAPVSERPSLAQQAGRQRLSVQGVAATLAALPGTLPLALLWPERLALAIIAVVVVTVLFVWYVRKRIGGLTGDCIGAIAYASQFVVLLTCAA
ncbi:MAG TPA: adenosylcobinamide-GDP ribazoletransferase [Pirellulales bacterium]|nr:adenosylcobinamide-GDP ribazoletransferase [Pirellulales bacterium]